MGNGEGAAFGVEVEEIVEEERVGGLGSGGDDVGV